MEENELRFGYDAFFGGFAKFIEENFSDIATISRIFADANRFQRGNESIEELLNKRGGDGKLILRIIKAYEQHFKKDHPWYESNTGAVGSSTYLQAFSEAVTQLMHKN